MNKFLDFFRRRMSYNVTYTPLESEQKDVVQVYKVKGHPRFHAWKTKAGNAVFTTHVLNRGNEHRTFRFDRVISIDLALV